MSVLEDLDSCLDLHVVQPQTDKQRNPELQGARLAASPSPRAQRLGPARVPGRAPSLPRPCSGRFHTANSHNGAGQSEGDPITRCKAQPWHLRESLEPVQAEASSLLSLHQPGNLAPATASQASVSSPLKWEDGTHTSELWLRIKYRSGTRGLQSKACQAPLCCAGIVGFSLLSQASPPILEAHQAEPMPGAEVRAQAPVMGLGIADLSHPAHSRQHSSGPLSACL